MVKKLTSLFGVVFLSLLLNLSALSGSDQDARRISIFFSGHVKGNFKPCGCKAGPAGGLARRVGYTHDYAKQSGDYLLQVDLGSYFQPLGPHSKAINELMIESLRRLPMQVLNLSPDDLHIWDRLAGMDLSTQVISTNLRPGAAGRPAPPRYAIVPIPGAEVGLGRDLKIGFLGISDPRKVKPNSGFVGLDPEAAVASAQRELAGQVDFVVVLANLDLGPKPFQTDSLPARIARAHDNIYAILVAEKRYLLRSPLQVNNAVLLSSVERGRHLGRLTLVLDQDGNVTQVQPEFTELSAEVPEDAYFLERQLELEAVLP